MGASRLNLEAPFSLSFTTLRAILCLLGVLLLLRGK